MENNLEQEKELESYVQMSKAIIEAYNSGSKNFRDAIMMNYDFDKRSNFMIIKNSRAELDELKLKHFRRIKDK